MAVEYEIGEELDNLDITWLDADGNVRNLSSGWTFEFKLGTEGKAALLTKTTGITGAATAPNVVIAWAVDELVVPAGSYRGQLRARRTSDNKDLMTKLDMVINPVIT
jgi:hypothetical protein